MTRDINYRGGSFDLAAWITEHKLPVVQEKNWNGGKVWVLSPCPWNSDHTNRAAHIIQFSNGAIAAGCHHNGCDGNGWHELREIYEPGYPSLSAVAKAVTGSHWSGHRFFGLQKRGAA